MAVSAALPRAGVHPWPMDKIPDPEVPERPTRRHFSGAYKAAILHELDQATEPGAKGAIMRREGLYSSSITEWRKQRAAGNPPRPGSIARSTRGRPARRRERGAVRQADRAWPGSHRTPGPRPGRLRRDDPDQARNKELA